MNRAERGPWFWILGGCGCLVVSALLVVGLLVWSGARMVRHVAEQLEDPAARRAAAERVLGAAVPHGYASAVGIEIPLVGDVAILHAREVEGNPGGAVGRTFVLVRSRLLAGADDAGSGADAGTAQFEEIVRQQGFRVDRTARVGGGRLVLDRFDARWVGYRGTIDDEHGRRPVLTSIVSLACPTPDRRGRVAMWIGAPPAGEETSSLDGTVVDPAELEALLRQIDPCPRRQSDP